MDEMTKYHSDDYIKFLKTIRPDNISEYSKQMQRCELNVRLDQLSLSHGFPCFPFIERKLTMHALIVCVRFIVGCNTFIVVKST